MQAVGDSELVPLGATRNAQLRSISFKSRPDPGMVQGELFKNDTTNITEGGCPCKYVA